MRLVLGLGTVALAGVVGFLIATSGDDAAAPAAAPAAHTAPASRTQVAAEREPTEARRPQRHVPARIRAPIAAPVARPAAVQAPPSGAEAASEPVAGGSLLDVGAVPGETAIEERERRTKVAKTLLWRGRYEQALEASTELLARYPGMFDAQDYMISAYCALGEAEQAAAHLTKVGPMRKRKAIARHCAALGMTLTP